MNNEHFHGLSAIGQIHVPVMDLERAVHFYQDQLGLAFSFQTESMAFFDCQGVRLMLGLPEREGVQRTSSILYFDVADIHHAHQALQERGVEFIGDPHLVAEMPDHDLWMAFFQDSEQNLMALMAEQQSNMKEKNF